MAASSFDAAPARSGQLPFDPVASFSPVIKLTTGINIVPVPYKGAAGEMIDLLGRPWAGPVQAMVSAMQTVAAPAAYEAKRLPATRDVVLANRSAPPDAILHEVFKRTNDPPFRPIDDDIRRNEIAALSEHRGLRQGAPARALTTVFFQGEVNMINEALRTLLPFAGWDEARTNALEITGAYDPVIRTPFRVTETAVAALSAVGLAVDDVWHTRTGRRQTVSIDTRQATASLRSSFYIKLQNEVVSNARNQVMGFYPAKNGRWSYVHANFPHHRAIALKLLNVPEDRAAVRKAVAGWDALELEEALVAAGGVGGMVRSRAEWAEHPQGKAIASLPIMEIIKIGDAPAEPFKPLQPGAMRPLAGVRVLDLTRVIAGPSCARTLAEHGAEVMKISAAHLPHLGRQELDTGHGKLSAQLDLREARDTETLKGLVRDADIFSQGYRPGTIGARGFSPEALHALRPGIVAVSLCAFSHAGPWASRRGFDTVVQSVSGITQRQGEAFPGAEPGPQFYPSSAIDFLTGYLMAFGATVALKRRALEGGSWLVRVSLAQAGRWLVQRGEVDAAELPRAVEEFSPEEIERWTITSQTPQGQLWHLKPVLKLSETMPHWDKPTVPLGYHRPVWPG